MRQIRKIGAPRQYLTWCREAIKSGQDYTNLSGGNKDVLLNRLIEEQGFICAYTLRKITPQSCHVEHVKPESLLRAEDKINGTKGSDLNYYNMLACYPRDNAPSHIAYGARKKDNWWENDGTDFISPIKVGCESCFLFNINGEISAKRNIRAAKKTIEVLALDNPSLTDDRHRVIKEFIYGHDGQDPLTFKKIDTAIVDIVKLQGGHHYYEFCVPIRDALFEYKKLLEKITNKKKYSKQQIKRKKK